MNYGRLLHTSRASSNAEFSTEYNKIKAVEFQISLIQCCQCEQYLSIVQQKILNHCRALACHELNIYLVQLSLSIVDNYKQNWQPHHLRIDFSCYINIQQLLSRKLLAEMRCEESRKQLQYNNLISSLISHVYAVSISCLCGFETCSVDNSFKMCYVGTLTAVYSDKY